MKKEFERLYGQHTPPSYRTRLHHWFADNWTDEFGAPTKGQPERTAEELAGRRIGEAERIANTLLAQSQPSNQSLLEWVVRIANDPTFAEHLDMSDWENIVKHAGDPIDRAICILATQVVEHRLTGEPDTEYTAYLVGGVTVTSSLAASVAEFVADITNAYATIAYRHKMGIAE